MSALERTDLSENEVTGPFLGVLESAGGYAWKDRLEPSRIHVALAIAQQHHVPEVLGRMLASRLGEQEDVGIYLDPSLKKPDAGPCQSAGYGKSGRTYRTGHEGGRSHRYLW